MQELLSSPQALVQLGETVKQLLCLMALCGMRMFAMAQLFVPLNDTAISGPMRNGMCLTFTIFIAWAQPIDVVASMSTLMLAGLILKELMIGVVIGFSASLVFWVAEGVGALIDNQAGFSNAQQKNMMSGEDATPVANLLGQLAQGCFWILGGMTVLLGVIYESYAWWPLYRITPDMPQVLERFLAAEVKQLMVTMLTLASPMLLVLLMVDLTFGVLAKTADKLEPNNLAQPIKGAIALLMLSVLVAVYFQQSRPALSLRQLAGEMRYWMQPREAPSAPAPQPAPR
ncbi:type III secretion system export apparatus subunit SctT [Aquincola sp. S2]|uniref:Type III secretion system export apparatus subunit SctT n=1 Tax=Pseudaquabacterium terrae TaxID=2732868 RepID=A0ABX2EUM7_9BURK|nr:type III secretion system export apparatus subunit SctT [Aquabacterium terrae]NRF72175.1 type III secretion system export apparatus subunit SctT [Aquabacterium terrae]